LATIHPTEQATWPPEAVATVQQLAQDLSELRERADQLQRALYSRIVIEQAKGVLAERLAVAPDEAFDVLRRSARSSRTRLHDLARDVVVSPRTPSPVAQEIGRRRGHGA
jgi:AmiR/NasT family two-component response regulator